MSFTKDYIGNARQVGELDIVRVAITKEKLTELLANNISTFEDREYLIFEVAKKKEADEFGHTHHAYISNKVAEAPQKKPSTRKRKRA